MVSSTIHGQLVYTSPNIVTYTTITDHEYRRLQRFETQAAGDARYIAQLQQTRDRLLGKLRDAREALAAAGRRPLPTETVAEGVEALRANVLQAAGVLELVRRELGAEPLRVISAARDLRCELNDVQTQRDEALGTVRKLCWERDVAREQYRRATALSINPGIESVEVKHADGTHTVVR